MMLSTGIWQYRTKLSVECGDSLLFVNSSERCVIPVAPLDTSKNDRVTGYGVWYKHIDEYELTIALANRFTPKWKPAFFRVYDDFLQWFEPREGQDFNIYHTMIDERDVQDAYFLEYEKTLGEIIRYRQELAQQNKTVNSI